MVSEDVFTPAQQGRQSAAKRRAINFDAFVDQRNLPEGAQILERPTAIPSYANVVFLDWINERRTTNS